ncbi:hypothetical protein IQ250_27085 [Pseudanabaenaceae cyanobacterium LEGE 13415]|nr:hypothetical protein [Pseudanabaenaceae cyanobacterium LEGE 13415]
MTQSGDWHDRFQADLEAMRLRMEEADRRAAEFDRRMEDYFENQARLNADLRTRQELQQQESQLQQQEIQALQEERRLELQQLQSMRENLLIQSDNISQLSQTVREQITPAITRLANLVTSIAEESRQHRSDGHGA